jgi:hypothetical protein
MKKREHLVSELRFDSPFKGAVCIHQFDAPLTFFHSATLGPTFAYQISRMMKLPLELIAPTVKLHGDDVLLLERQSSSTNQDNLAKSIADWFRQKGVEEEFPHRLVRAASTTPIEDGFFTALSINHGGLSDTRKLDPAGPLKWEPVAASSETTSQILVEFIEREVKRISNRRIARWANAR